MILDANKAGDLNSFSGDLCIVGSGIAGSFLAYLLMNIKTKIVIVEKGDESDWAEVGVRSILDSKNDRIPIAEERHYKLGGLGSIWGGQLAEFTEADIKKNFWGLEYSELCGFYEKIYDFFQIPKNNFIQSNSPVEFEKKLKFYHTVFLKKPDTYKYFKNEFEKSKNIFILKNLSATNIVFKNKTAIHLECQSKNKKKITIKANQFVLSMGTIENNRFFLNAKRYSKDAPFKENENIGKYFHDHIGLCAGKLQSLNKNFLSSFENKIHKGFIFQPKIVNIVEPYEKKIIVSAQVLFDVNDKETLKLKKKVKEFINNKTISNAFQLIKESSVIKKILDMYIHSLYTGRVKAFNSFCEIFFQSEQTVSKNSKIFIPEFENQEEEDGLKKVKIDWKINETDFDEIRNFVKKISFFLKKNFDLDFVPSYFLDNNDLIYRNLLHTNHPCGGLIISKNKIDGVCDKNMKVWDTDNLFVNGASTFPNSSFANTGLTILALTYRLSFFLQK